MSELTAGPEPAWFEELFSRPLHEVARELIGCTLLVDGVGGVIVESEAYAPGDAASHSFRGRTARNAAMFGLPGHLYVYRSYGIHWCANVVCEPTGVGAAVLLRALEPISGLEEMAARRGLADPLLLCSGPGRLTQALGISGAHDGRPLDGPPFLLVPRTGPPPEIVTGPRIGISSATELPWRYAATGSRFVSRPRPRA